MEYFRNLLERVPEYRVELRQILELRSVIHDDALHLSPPDDLSERVRSAVAEKFAALAPAVDSVQIDQLRPRPRRSGFSPVRLAASVAVFATLATLVALTPTVKQPLNMQSASVLQVRSSENEASSMRPSLTNTSRRSMRRASQTTARLDPMVQLPLSSRPVADVLSGDGMLPVKNEVEIQGSDQDFSQQAHSTSVPVLALGLLDPKLMSPLGERDTNLIVPKNSTVTPGFISTLPLPGDSPRTFALGVTLGSGNVEHHTAPTMLLQNSYYFAFSVSKNDRVGVEMGASVFHRSSVTGNVQSGGFAKGSMGSPSEPGTKEATSTLPPTDPRQSVQTSDEGQVTYGTVFYDRRMTVNSSVDICGRVAFGGADNALLTNVRAYAAYSPSRNITLTLGVGGSALFNVSSRGNNSTNYGIYYGIETGF